MEKNAGKTDPNNKHRGKTGGKFKEYKEKLHRNYLEFLDPEYSRQVDWIYNNKKMKRITYPSYHPTLCSVFLSHKVNVCYPHILACAIFH